ncbi:ribosome silencing factor [Membranihabitans maritimus]|uniref:ribosome silencing factor n=1 Tax=Membranihabitans maritimus TaxID=2904244 RepID=UPI001F01BD07|nr:ribosome silencing factor [Membranihabitans maritimus]
MQAKLKENPQYKREHLNDFIIEKIQDHKGKNILKFDLRSLETPPTDFFIICEADSVTHVKSIAGNLEKDIKDEIGLFPSYTDGKTQSTWIAIDYFTTIIHVFYSETRKFYDLEGLWQDAEITEYENI